MQIGIIGAGNMGTALANNLVDNGHKVVIYNRSKERLQNPALDRMTRCNDLKSFVEALPREKHIWLVIPEIALESLLAELVPMLSSGDVLVDYSNAHYRTTKLRYEALRRQGIGLIDVGFCGGMLGAREGACFVVGGDENDVKKAERSFLSIASEGGYSHIAGPGSGHYIKMVHNGIEYAMMQAIGEGLSLLEAAPYEIDLADLSAVWSSGAIISGNLMNQTNQILHKEDLEDVLPRVETSGEASFALLESVERKVSIPAIAASLFARYKSEDQTKISEKLVATLRGEFGGHAVHKKGKEE